MRTLAVIAACLGLAGAGVAGCESLPDAPAALREAAAAPTQAGPRRSPAGAPQSETFVHSADCGGATAEVRYQNYAEPDRTARVHSIKVDRRTVARDRVAAFNADLDARAIEEVAIRCRAGAPTAVSMIYLASRDLGRDRRRASIELPASDATALLPNRSYLYK